MKIEKNIRSIFYTDVYYLHMFKRNIANCGN